MAAPSTASPTRTPTRRACKASATTLTPITARGPRCATCSRKFLGPPTRRRIEGWKYHSDRAVLLHQGGGVTLTVAAFMAAMRNSRRPAKLRSVAIQMLDAGAVAPNDLVALEPEDGGDAVPFGR